MKRIGSVLVLIIGFALGAAVTRYYDSHQPSPKVAQATPVAPAKAEEPPAPARVANVSFDREPLWAYGFTGAAKPGDSAPPQAPPSSQPRPNQDLTEQTKPRQVEGSTASYNLV